MINKTTRSFSKLKTSPLYFTLKCQSVEFNKIKYKKQKLALHCYFVILSLGKINICWAKNIIHRERAVNELISRNTL